MMQKSQEVNEVRRIGSMLLEIGALLMSAGANTERIRITVQRLAQAFQLHCELMITFRALTITISDHKRDYSFNSVKRTSPHGVNFKMVSGISRMSWKVVEDNWSIDQVKQELERLKHLPHYNAWITVPVVALAGASFCRIAGGEWIDMAVVFVATAFGLLIRRRSSHLNYNAYLSIFFSSLTASLITGLFIQLGVVPNKEYAFVTSVLFLVPGVPLINCFSDMIDGNLQNAVVRGLHGLIIAFMIALGLVTAMFLYH